MKDIKRQSSIFEFDSPVEFVLIGIGSGSPAVLAKSKGAKIDLAAYSQRAERLDLVPLRMNSFVRLFDANERRLPLNVSTEVAFLSNSAVDSRFAELSLVWRGAASSRHMRAIHKLFLMCRVDLVEAIEHDSAARLEWALSRVIDQCNRAATELHGAQVTRSSLFKFVSVLYAVVLVVFLIVR